LKQFGTIKPSELIIKRKYLNAVFRPTTEENNEIGESLKTNGQLERIKINKKKWVLDGFTRTGWGKKYKWKNLQYELKEFDDPLEEFKYVIETNVKRRQLNRYKRGILLLSILEIEKQIAKKRQKELGRTHGKAPSVQIGTKGRATEIVAKKEPDISATTIFKISKINTEGTKSQKKKAEWGPGLAKI